MSVAKTVWARLPPVALGYLSHEKGVCIWALSPSSPLLEEKVRQRVQKRLAEEVSSVGDSVGCRGRGQAKGMWTFVWSETNSAA